MVKFMLEHIGISESRTVDTEHSFIDAVVNQSGNIRPIHVADYRDYSRRCNLYARHTDMTSEAALNALANVAPDCGFSLAVEAKYMSDWLVAAGPDDIPLGIARPKTTEQISRLLVVCNAHAIPVVPQGGLTGMTGGATPVKGALLISLERMNKIEAIDCVGQTITVEAGVQLQTIQEAADAEGFLFPLDIGSRGSCQIGGNLATNAGGNRVLCYGMARDMVLGLEVVLADGTVITAMNKMMKNNAGYDLKQIFLGSEGTLGIITRAVLKLYAKPKTLAVALTAHSDYPQLERFLMQSRAHLGGTLTAFEVMWPEFYAQGAARIGGAAPLPVGSGAYALIEVSASDDSAQAQLSSLLEAGVETGVVDDAVLAQSIGQAQNIWSIRDTSGALSKSFDPIGNFDVGLETGRIHDFVTECRTRLETRWPGVSCYFFGHVVDGNVHLIAGDFPQGDTLNVEEAVYDCVRDFSGSISAEHGIGTQKRGHLEYSRSLPEIALMRQMKSNLDPQNILNPGKVFL
jgi:FAD/FMN-containing dehydrogenase